MASRGEVDTKRRSKEERAIERERRKEERSSERERDRQRFSDEREEKYEAARERLKTSLAQGLQGTDFYPDLSANLVKRMVEGDPSVGTIQKDRLIKLMERGIGSMAYQAIARALEQTKGGMQTLVETICGNYFYFRHDNPVVAENGKLSEGQITIARAENGDIGFSRWPPDPEPGTDSPPKGPPEHVGHAFFAGNKLFLLGWKPGMLLLGIAHCSQDGCGLMSGYVLSVRSGGGAERIFTAPFILVRKNQTNLIDRFRSESGVTEFQIQHSGHRTGYWDG